MNEPPENRKFEYKMRDPFYILCLSPESLNDEFVYTWQVFWLAFSSTPSHR
jgi:hypothetical protein